MESADFVLLMNSVFLGNYFRSSVIVVMCFGSLHAFHENFVNGDVGLAVGKF